MIAENPLLKKMFATGEERVGKIATQLLGNEKFMAAMQKMISRAMDAKGTLERSAQAALNAMNIPSSADVQRLSDKIDELERVFEALSTKIDELAQKQTAPPAPPKSF